MSTLHPVQYPSSFCSHRDEGCTPCTHIHVHTCIMHVRTRTHTHTHTHTHTGTRTHTHMHPHTCTHVHPPTHTHTALLTQWAEDLGRLMLMRNQNIAERARGMMAMTQGSQHTAMQMAQAAQAAAAQAAQSRPPGHYPG